jgi:hypothetical protein
MTRKILLALVAATALAGCNEDHTIVTGGPDDGNDGANAAENATVALPPSISASKIYRCANNHVIYVDWLSDGKTANIRTDKNGPPTQVAAAEAGKPMTAAGGYSLSGSASASSVRIAVPGQHEESCKA